MTHSLARRRVWLSAALAAALLVLAHGCHSHADDELFRVPAGFMPR